MTNTLSHAQNRHYRRIANRYEPQGKQSGQPISGELTPAEKAHKARRHMRRLEILKERVKSLQMAHLELSSRLRELEQGGEDCKSAAKAMRQRVQDTNERLIEAGKALQKLTEK